MVQATGGKENTKVNAQRNKIPQFVKGKAPVVVSKTRGQ
jgi:hypothetical protein